MVEKQATAGSASAAPVALPKHPFLRWLHGVRHLVFAAASLVLFLAALWVLHRELAHVHLRDVLAHFRAVSGGQIGIALVFTLGSYLSLTGYDVLALRYIGRRLPYPRVAMISFTAVAVGHNVGLAMISAGVVRLRMYTAAGLSAAEVAVIVMFCTLTFGIGVTFVGGVALAAAPAEAAALLNISDVQARLVGIAILIVLGIYMGWGVVRREPLQLGGWQVPLPAPEVTIHQLVLAALDLCCAAAVLYTLLPADLGVSYPYFLSIFVIAIVVGIASHVPAGAGVFETVLLLAMPDAPRDVLLGAILAYRLVYYLMPLALAAALAGAHEMHVYRASIRRGVALAGDSLTHMAPQILGVAVFLAGFLLLASGATSTSANRLDSLSGLLPLGVIEVAHLLGSLAGVGLLILARELYQRVQEAYRLSVWLLAIGILACLIKGLDFEEALVLTVIFGALWLGRDAFDRHGSLLEQSFSAAWAAAVIFALIGTLWLGLFSFKHVAYDNALWWQFAYDGDTGRFLRASFVSIIAAGGFSLAHLLRPPKPEPELPGSDDLHRALAVIADCADTRGHLALVGDKRLLFDDRARAFLMYQIRGRSWISLGDPVGPPEHSADLVWRFNELCDGHGGRVAFFQVDAQNLPLYLDLGLAPMKIGEEAVVSLEGRALAEHAWGDLTRIRHGTQWSRTTFEVAETSHVKVLMPQLRSLSETWLSGRRGRERGFIQGNCEPAYLSHFPCALVRQAGEPVAFANLWLGADRAELAADLVRCRPDAPEGMLDYLFAELLIWGATEGYRKLNLGLAPLAGLESHPLAPLWRRVGTLLFRYGEHFSTLAEVRAFKERFQPTWRPKYVAASRGIGLPGVLLDVAALISAGPRG